MAPNPSAAFYTIPQLAECLGVSAQSIRNWIRSERIEPPQEIPATGDKVYTAEAVARIERDYMVRAAAGGTRGPGASSRRDRAQAYVNSWQNSVGASIQTPAEIVLDEVHRWLELRDDLLPTVILTTVVANWLADSQPVWTMIVAPPSSGKTALIQAVEEIPGVYGLGKLTARTFVSGMMGESRSLLTWLQLNRKWLLTHKDWGTIMSLNPTERNEILAQLRQIYDGKFNARFGTGVEVNWKGTLGFIVGATPAVDSLQKWSTELGERFIQFRPTAPDPHRVTIRASLNKGREREMEEALADAYSRAFDAAKSIAESHPNHAPQGDLIAGALANLIALARTPVRHDRYGGGFEVTESEGPARLAGVLTQVYRAASLIYGGDADAANALTVRLGLDSITPGVRRRLISRLAGSEWGLVVKDLGRTLGCDDNTARRHLDDLCELRLATRTEPAKTAIYSPSDRLQDLVSQVYLDEFKPQEALRKLSLLHTHFIHEE